MEFNPSKCQVVHVTGSKKTVQTDNVLHGQVLEPLPCARYLVVDISSGLTWNSHIDRCNSDSWVYLNYLLLITYYLRNIKTKVREAAYNSIVR